MTQQALVQDSGLTRVATNREARALACRPKVNTNAGAAITLTVEECAPGSILIRSGNTAGVADTLPTAAALTAANPDIGDGDSFTFEVSNINTSSGIITLTASTGVTLYSGSTATLAIATKKTVLLTRTSATAWVASFL